MRLREVEEAEKKQMMKERQQKLLEGQLVRNTDRAAAAVSWNISHRPSFSSSTRVQSPSPQR